MRILRLFLREKRLCDVHFWNFCWKVWKDERGSGRRPFYYSTAPDKLPDYTSIFVGKKISNQRRPNYRSIDRIPLGRSIQQEYTVRLPVQDHEKNTHSRKERVVLGLVVMLRNVEEEQWYTTATTTTTTTSVVVTSILPLFFRHRRLHPRHHPRDDDHNTKNNNSSNSVRRGNFDRPEEEEGTTSY